MHPLQSSVYCGILTQARSSSLKTTKLSPLRAAAVLCSSYSSSARRAAPSGLRTTPRRYVPRCEINGSISTQPIARLYQASYSEVTEAPDGSRSTSAGKATITPPIRAEDGRSARPSKSSTALDGKVAIITGASRGIGFAIASLLARTGARCILVGRNASALTSAMEKLDSPSEGKHSIAPGNVGDKVLWKEILENEKRIDVLINAAGITHYSPLFVTSVASLEEVVQTNLMGCIVACREVGKRMIGNRASGGACIINVASLLGTKGGQGSVGYASSKAGVIGLTRALAAEVGKANIRVNVIVPGYIETKMTSAMTPEARSDALKAIPLGRFGEASEIAEGALFLATNQYANNCVLNLDGGLSAT